MKDSELFGPSLAYLILEAMWKYEKIHITSSNMRDYLIVVGVVEVVVRTPVSDFCPALQLSLNNSTTRR